MIQTTDLNSKLNDTFPNYGDVGVDKQLGTGGSKHWGIMRKHLDWFMKHNAKAYMVLLD